MRSGALDPPTNPPPTDPHHDRQIALRAVDEQAGASSAWVFGDAPLKLLFDGSYSKRLPIAVEQPVLYTSPFRR